VERINREQYNGFRELFYSFLRVEIKRPTNILTNTIVYSLNTYEEKKELENFRAVQRFILSDANKNIERLRKTINPQLFVVVEGITS
tara:strand:+ start:391 stop:651 length:261 start_codon:yes stop_codon:yes gene_type:complete